MKVLYALFLFVFINLAPLVAGDSLSLYIFLLDDCPICIQYSPTLNELHDEYADRIAFIGYFPNFSSKQNKIDLFREAYNIKYPLFTDYFKIQSKKYKAQVTPEVVLYNNSEDKIIYQGRIDNKFYKLGRRRNVVTEHDLKTAIEQTLNNRSVEKAFAEPIGCYINYADNFVKKTKNGN